MKMFAKTSKLLNKSLVLVLVLSMLLSLFAVGASADEAAAFSADVSASSITATKVGNYPVQFTLTNPTAEDMQITLAPSNTDEIVLSYRGTEEIDGVIAMDAGTEQIISANVAVTKAFAGKVDIDVDVVSGSDVLETLTITLNGLDTLVADGGFEADSLLWKGGAADADAHNGDAALALASEEATYSEAVELTEGNLYALGFWAKADVADTTVNAKLTNSADAFALMAINDRFVLTTEWAYYEADFIANAAESTLSFIAAGNVSIDDVVLIDTETAPTIEKDNPGFEEYNGGGTNYDFPSYFFYIGDELETEDVFNGSQSVKMIADGNAHNLGMNGYNGNGFLFNEMDQTYTFSIWMKGLNEGTETRFLTSEYINNEPTGSEVTHSFYPSTEWERYVFTYETAESSEEIWKHNGAYLNLRYYGGELLMDDCYAYISTAAEELNLDELAVPEVSIVNMVSDSSFESTNLQWNGGAASADANTGAGALALASEEAVYNKTLDLTDGNLYVLGFWAKSDVAGTAVYAKMENSLMAFAPMAMNDRFALTIGWAYYECRFLASDSEGTLSFETDGNVLIDDVVLVDTGVAPVIEKDNPGFETYTDATGNATGFPGYFFHTGDALETDDIFNGGQSVKMMADGNGHNLAVYGVNNDSFLFNQMDQTYVFSIWMKANNEGTSIRFTAAEYANNAPTGRNEEFTFYPTSEWARYTFTYKTLASSPDIWKHNGSYLNFRYYGGEILFDDCYVYTTTAADKMNLSELAAVQASGSKYDFEGSVSGWTGGTVSTDVSYNGAQSMKIEAEGTATLNETLVLRTGNVYRVGMYTASDAAGALKVKIADYNANGEALSVPASLNARAQLTAEGSYYEYTFVANFAGDKEYAYSIMELENLTDGDVYVDDVTLLNGAASAANEASNGSLEVTPKDPWFLGNAGVHGEVTEEDAYAGSKSAKIYAGNLGYSGFHMAEPDTTYTLSFWAKGEGSTIRWQTAEYLNNEPTERNVFYYFDLSDEWELYSITYKSSPTNADIWKYNGVYLNFMPTGTVYMDDLSIMKTGFMDQYSDDVFTTALAAPVVKDLNGSDEPDVPVEPEVPEVTFTDTGRTLSLDGIVHINQYAAIEGDVDQAFIEANGGLLIWKSEPAEADYATADEVVEGLEYNTQYGDYGQATNGIAAKEFADELYMAIYLEVAEGVYAYGPVKEFSVQQYCETVLASSKQPQKMKDLAVAMLHYGTAAQTYFNYNTADMANANIAAQYPADTWDAGLLDALVPYTTELTAVGNVANTAKSLALDGAVLVNYYFQKTDADIVSGELQIWKGVTNLTEENITETKEMTFSPSYGGEWTAASLDFVAKEYGVTAYARAVLTDAEGNEYTSDIVAFSPEEYANIVISRNTKEAELAKYLVMYGERARLYFG